MIRIRDCAILFVMATTSIIALAQQTNPSTLPPLKTLPKLALEKVQSFSVKVHYSNAQKLDAGLELTFIADYEVQAEQPDLVRIIDVSSTKKTRIYHRKDGTSAIFFSQNYVSDGKRFLIWDTVIGSYYMLKEFKTGAGALSTLQRTQGPHILFPEILFTPDALSKLNFKADGNETLNGKKTAVYRSQPPGKPEIVIYLDTSSHLPIRISAFDKDGNGDRLEWQRSDFTDWKLNIAFPPKTFDTTPPPGLSELGKKSPVHASQ